MTYGYLAFDLGAWWVKTDNYYEVCIFLWLLTYEI